MKHSRSLGSLLAIGLGFGLGILACSHETKSEQPSSDQKSPVSAETDAGVVDPACPTQGGQRDDSLSGACVTGAQCSFSTPGGPGACKPGWTFVPVVPAQWMCTCPYGKWDCEVVGGGLGTLVCPGADAGIP